MGCRSRYQSGAKVSAIMFVWSLFWGYATMRCHCNEERPRWRKFLRWSAYVQFAAAGIFGALWAIGV